MTTISIETLKDEYLRIRKCTEKLVEPLEIEDFIVQADTHVSPSKWHLAHTTWFFETFLLKNFFTNYHVFHKGFNYLFNSYYETVGKFHPQKARGLITRPTVSETFSYRKYVDEHILSLVEKTNQTDLDQIKELIEIGLNHEQQHQELLLTDLKYNFSFNPTHPVYMANDISDNSSSPQDLSFIEIEGGLVEIGSDGEGFSFDNERPRHKKWLDPYRLANRPVTNGEYIQFIEDGGYLKAEFWLSDGWNAVNKYKWQAPQYWEKHDGKWYAFTLSGLLPIDEYAPVTHISFYEADAYARWAGRRLPTEEEWEHGLQHTPVEGNFADQGYFHPISKIKRDTTQPFLKGFGDVWEWTQSSYSPYPRNKPLKGALGEYNAKFMANQMVLKGGSCATPESHIRLTYRNFFYPQMRWQFSGVRLAEDVL
ncbi:ergothioneine biosynthesis protein EgtB [Gracilibacillus sp. YIM 98692]|uniref:ergothioneine biosynthesis protein EgtB n=1 Tax=Gracilibacillus sp. YIM 98692 TaxID=2663532 RepID=UPI0013D5CADC|nr:ergothioneine biosynthesis protein EgtB [Gracilibacillus sp. YIM 98692]